MLTRSEELAERLHGENALELIERMKGIIRDFENPMREMTLGEFSSNMHRALNAYDREKNELESIYRAEFWRTFLDDDDEEA